MIVSYSKVPKKQKWPEIKKEKIRKWQVSFAFCQTVF